eukprot:761546-Hanusia_phi.AAC.1
MLARRKERKEIQKRAPFTERDRSQRRGQRVGLFLNLDAAWMERKYHPVGCSPIRVCGYDRDV